MSEPSKITKVLVSKIHGGRKQDSKFWKSEFSDETVSKPKPTQPNVVGFFLYPLIMVALFIGGYGSYYIYTRFFVSPNVSAKAVALKSASIKDSGSTHENYSSSTEKQQTYSSKPKDRPVTQKELDRAIKKALHQRSTTNSSVQKTSELPYYRVELTSGSIINAKSAIKDGTHYTIKDVHGLDFSMSRSDIKSVKKIFPE